MSAGADDNHMKNITFVIFTFNEEKRIGAVVKNCIKYGEVLVLDGGSTDATQKITEELGGRFVLRPQGLYGETQPMYEFMKQHVTTSWIFWNFADIMLPKILLEKLTEISQQEKIKYVMLPLDTYLWGETKYPAEHGRSPRFFHKDYLDFSDNRIHGMGKFLGAEDEKLELTGAKYAAKHFSVYNIEKFVIGHLKYANIEAQERFDNGERFKMKNTLIGMIRLFGQYYRASYKNKGIGLMTALAYAFFRFMIFLRLYEIEHQLTLDTIEENYAKEKERINQEIYG